MVPLDIFADPICPWCYLGKTLFDRALAERPDHPFAIEWQPFRLDPDTPPEGRDHRAWLEAKLGREGAAAAERTAQGKTSGTVRVEDEGVVVVADLPKKVSWDQDRLAAMAERIRAAGDDPTEYLEIAYRVPERRYGAWPAAMREGFADARSETTGKPVFRLEARDR